MPVAELPPNVWRTTLKRRLVIAAAMMAVWAVAVEVRLIYLQVVRRAGLVARAEDQQSDAHDVPGTRGQILDRHGHVLARSVDARTITADPKEIESPQQAAAAICAALPDCSADERAALTAKLSSDKRFVYLRRQVPREQAQRVVALKIKGIDSNFESRRFYPNRELLAHVLGFANIDHVGLSGIEKAYDDIIRGSDGRVVVRQDKRHTPFSVQVEKAPTTGASVELTIDTNKQYIVERELLAGVRENGAVGGSVIVMDPWTGDILALANVPTFNPNTFGRAPSESLRNRATQSLLEPGSTFKLVTAAAALELGVVAPDDRIDVSGGQIQIGPDIIRDTHKYTSLTFSDVIVKSSNVGAIKVGALIGKKRFGEYIERFGFGQHVAPKGFPGESRGIVWNSSTLTDRALASVSMGYQIAVTPLQIVTAVSSVANGGRLMRPRILQSVIDEDGRHEVPTVEIRRTVSEKIATQLTTIMEGVVQSGTGTLAQIPGYTIAGKTGTAAKLINGRYSKSDYNASFVGYFPSRQPKYAMVVVIDSPRGRNGYYGGQVAAPIFRRIAEVLLRNDGIPPSINAPTPVLVERRTEPVHEIPVSGRIASRTLATANGAAVFPDVTGLGGREALAILVQHGMTPRMHGTGIVIGQKPAAGTPLGSGGVATVWLTRQPPVRMGETAAQ